MTKQIFEVIVVIPHHCVHYLGLRDNKLGGMDMTEFEPSKLGTRAQYVRQFTLKN